MKILEDYYTPKIVEPDYKFSVSGTYYAPEASTIREHLDYIESLPMNHTPEVFWLHSNANLTASINEAVSMLRNALQLMSSFKGGGGGDDEEDASAKAETPEMRYSNIAASVVDQLPPAFDLPAANRKYPVDYNQCLNTVLSNELLKFAKLYFKLRDTCVNLQLAVKGLVIFSPELESVSIGMLTNSIPPEWIGVSYPSLKPLLSYVFDFIARCKFVDDWIKQGTVIIRAHIFFFTV